MKTIFGSIIGFAIGFAVWFPYGIMYAVQANSGSGLVKFISAVKGVLELWM